MIKRAIEIANHFMERGLDTKVSFVKSAVGDVFGIAIRVRPDAEHSKSDIVTTMNVLGCDPEYIEIEEYDVAYVIV